MEQKMDDLIEGGLHQQKQERMNDNKNMIYMEGCTPINMHIVEIFDRDGRDIIFYFPSGEKHTYRFERESDAIDFNNYLLHRFAIEITDMDIKGHGG